MGVYPKKNCLTNPRAQAPDPARYTVVLVEHYKNATLIVADYAGCTNYEGRKIMVYQGNVIPSGTLDPHFSEHGIAPVARFSPSEQGLRLARIVCNEL